MEPSPLFHKRPLLFAAMGLCLGTALFSCLVVPYLYAAAGILLVVGLCAFKLRRTALGLVLLMATLGLIRGQASRLPAPDTGSQLPVSGRVCDSPVENAVGWSVLLCDASVSGQPCRGRLRLILSGEGAPPAYGQTVSLRADVAAPMAPYDVTDRFNRVCGTAFCKTMYVEKGDVKADAYGVLLTLRDSVGNRITALFGQNAGAAKAMLLGDKGEVEDKTYRAFQDTGVLHLMAVSGLHTGILAGAFQLLFRRNRWVRFFATAAFLTGYALLTALSPSVLRAAVMVLTALLAAPLFRRPDTPSALSLACLIILLINPYALFYGGFQLSFCAVLGIVTLSPRIKPVFGSLGDAFSGLISASLSVLIATAPLMARLFQEVNLISLLTNILVLPVTPFFLVPAFLSVALSYLSMPLGTALAVPAKFVLDTIVAVTKAGGSLTIPLPSPPGAAVLLFLFSLLLFSPLCNRPPKRRNLMGGGCMVLSLLLWVMV